MSGAPAPPSPSSACAPGLPPGGDVRLLRAAGERPRKEAYRQVAAVSCWKIGGGISRACILPAPCLTNWNSRSPGQYWEKMLVRQAQLADVPGIQQ